MLHHTVLSVDAFEIEFLQQPQLMDGEKRDSFRPFLIRGEVEQQTDDEVERNASALLMNCAPVEKSFCKMSELSAEFLALSERLRS